MLRPLLVNQSLALVFEEPEGIPPIYSDESKLSQILRNFISNALKYTERGEVRVARAADAGARRGGVHRRRHRHRHPGEGPRRGSSTSSCRSRTRCSAASRAPGSACRCRSGWPSCSAAAIGVVSTLGVGSTFSLNVPLVYRDPLQVEPRRSRSIRSASPCWSSRTADEDLLLVNRALAGTRYQVLHARTPGAAEAILSVGRGRRPSCSTSACTATRPGICWRGSSATPAADADR